MNAEAPGIPRRRYLIERSINARRPKYSPRRLLLAAARIILLLGDLLLNPLDYDNQVIIAGSASGVGVRRDRNGVIRI